VAHHLLLADDSVTIQRVIKLTFADEDVEVTTVGDGNLAVASIDKQPPDIVLADVAMPGRSGYEVAQHIRNSPRLAHIPILLLTGAFEPVDEARASQVGCDGVLAKPFEPDAVVSRVKELLAKGRPVAPARSVGAVASRGPFPAPVPPPPAPASLPGVFAVTDAASPAIALEGPPLPAAVAASTPRQDPADVDAYFERLDQAFATLAMQPRTPSAAPVEAADDAPAVPQALADAFAGLGAAKTPAATPIAAPAAPVWSAAAVPVSPATDAPVAASALSDAQVDHVVDRVIETLTARLGVNLADVVSTVAERMVRHEIDQIKKRL